MDYFFGYDVYLRDKIDWFFNLNHLFLICFVSVIIIGLLFLLHAKSEKGKKATKLSLAALMLILEVGRIIYKFLMHKHGGGTAADFNWWWNISFQMCAIMCWTTIITLVLSAFLKKENKFLQFMYNILFGCAMIGGILTFCYPDCIEDTRPFLHFVNIQTVLAHSLLIFVPIYLIKIGEFKVEIKNIWKPVAGYVYVGALSMTASLLSGNCFAYALKFDLIDLGLPFPWHLPVVMLVLMTIAAVLYGAFEIVRLIKRKIKKEPAPVLQKRDYNKLGVSMYVVANVSAILFGMLILLGTASLIGNRVTMLGFLCLIPLVYMILGLVFASYLERYKFAKLDIENKIKHITLITLAMVFMLPVGIIYLIAYLKESKTIKE